MREGCPRCGRGTEANPHRPGVFWFVVHELRCWGVGVLLYNAAWLWTHPSDEADERLGDGHEAYA